MKDNKQILDEFGEMVVSKCLDPVYAGVRDDFLKGLLNNRYSEFNNAVNKLSLEEKKKVIDRINEEVESFLFAFLRLFEEQSKFKLYYEDGEQKIDLTKASEMLKAEPIIENGWIARFSHEK